MQKNNKVHKTFGLIPKLKYKP